MNKISFLVLAVAFVACKSPRTKISTDEIGWSGEPSKSVGVQIFWIKNRGYEVHVSLKIYNKSDEEAMLAGEWISLEANGIPGVATKAPPVIKLAPDGGKSVLMKFRFDEKVPKKGAAKIVVTMAEPDHIFDATFPMKK